VNKQRKKNLPVQEIAQGQQSNTRAPTATGVGFLRPLQPITNDNTEVSIILNGKFTAGKSGTPSLFR
jgi:hypothetical protein